MSLEAAGTAVLNLVKEIGGETVTTNAFFVGAKTLIANGGLSEAWADIEAHDWQGLIDVGISQGAAVIAKVDPGLGTIAPLLASIIIYARHHPASTLSLAMKAADGMGGEDYGTGHVTI